MLTTKSSKSISGHKSGWDPSKFKTDYKIYGKYGFDQQAPHLGALGDLYKEKYRKFRNWTDCLRVSITSMLFTNEYF